MPALDSITIKGFKSIRSIENLALGEVNVLIGPNGSGKSNFIGALSFLEAVRTARLQSYVRRAGGAEKLLHFGSSETDAIRSTSRSKTKLISMRLTLEPTDTDTLYPYSRNGCITGTKRLTQIEDPISYHCRHCQNEAGISESDSHGIATHVRRHLRGWRLYHFHNTGSSSPMTRTADVNDNRRLRPDGSNLPAILYLLVEETYGITTE